MAEREKGSTKVECEECGRKLTVEEQPDGSLAASRCSHCHPIQERAEERTDKRETREKATNVEEQK